MTGDPSWPARDRYTHAVIWAGSKRPSWLRKLLTRVLFACRHLLPVANNDTACSENTQGLRAFFRTMKWMCTESVEDARVAFLAIVCPPSPHFTYHLAWRATTRLGLPIFWSGVAPQLCKLLIVYVHGGGFISGDYSGYQGMCEDLTRALGQDTCVLFPQYPLAPEESWPQLVKAVTATVTTFARPNVPVVMMGDSAGGALALASSLTLCDGNNGDVKPSAVCLFSPLVDAEGLGASRAYNTNRDVCFTGDLVRWSFAQCLQGLKASEVSVLSQ